MRPRDLGGALVLLPFLAAFGPGNCAPDEDFHTISAVPEERDDGDVDDDTYAITIPRGVAVIVQCAGGCNLLALHSGSPERVYAGATNVNDEGGAIGVLVGHVEGDAVVGVEVGDLGYSFSVHVVEREGGEASQGLRVITIGGCAPRRRSR